MLLAFADKEISAGNHAIQVEYTALAHAADSLPPSTPASNAFSPRFLAAMILNAVLAALIAIATVLASPLHQVKRDESKAVFAHLIVGNTYNY
ncbi:hypothetical protein FRC08_014665 [Ceratobasidium sp. 394]|nr:hypothetical protein FRC08_014665 [Ceratobasidium sp. 394]